MSVDAELVAFKTVMFYHYCVLKNNIIQSKLKSLQKVRDRYTIDRINMLTKGANWSEQDDFFDDIIELMTLSISSLFATPLSGYEVP